MKYCPECGCNIEDMKFCPECGYKVEALNESIKKPIDSSQIADDDEQILCEFSTEMLFDINSKKRRL